MAGTLTPTPYQTVLDSDGVAVSGAKVYTYEAGTTTNATTYTTSALNVANANPIVADSAGRYVAYLAAGQNLRFIIKTSADVTIDDQDNIQSVPGSSVNLDIEGTVGEAVTAGQVVYLSSAAESTPLTAGKWYLTDSDAAATSTTAQTIGVAVSAIAINTSGTIRLAGLVTTAGAVVVGTTYYVGPTPGALVSSAPALSRQVGVAMTTSTLVLAATTAVSASIPNPISQDLLFTDATYDIGKSGATRPRDLFTSRNATVGSDIVVSGTGPHAIGGATVDYVRLGLAGAFTSGGASTVAYGTYTSGALTGHSADSAAIAGVKLNNSVVTAGNCTTVAQLWVSEPQITVGAGAVTNSATVYIEGAASEASNDYALWVDAGATKLDGVVTTGSTLTVGTDLTVTEDLVVSGAGPHAMGAVVNDYTRLQLDGAFTSGGASTAMFGMHMSGALTGHSADSDSLVGTKLGNSIVTAGNCTTVAQLWVAEPAITVGSGTVTNSASVYIEGAATEATNDYALWVDAGATQLDGTLGVGGATTLTGAARLVAGTTFGSDTAAVNTLDDYEEGTWTGTAVNVTDTSALSVTNEGYTKIGNIVRIWGALDANGLATTGGSSYISGLPFTVGADYGTGSAMKNDYTQGGTIFFNASTDRIYITTFSTITGSIRFSGTYKV